MIKKIDYLELKAERLVICGPIAKGFPRYIAIFSQCPVEKSKIEHNAAPMLSMQYRRVWWHSATLHTTYPNIEPSTRRANCNKPKSKSAQYLPWVSHKHAHIPKSKTLAVSSANRHHGQPSSKELY